MKDRFPKGGLRNPFSTYGQGFEQTMDKSWEPFFPNTPTSARDQIRRNEMTGDRPTAVVLPPNVVTPDQSSSVNLLSGNVIIPAGGVETPIFSWKVPASMTVFFWKYSFINPTPTTLVMIPKVNNQRVLPYHGTPNVVENFSFQMRIGGVMGNSDMDLVDCQLPIDPKSILSWTAINTGGGDQTVSVRMVGYVTNSVTRKINKIIGG